MNGKPPYGPDNPAPLHVEMQEREESAKALGEKNGWGKLTGVSVLGDSVVYNFESGA